MVDTSRIDKTCIFWGSYCIFFFDRPIFAKRDSILPTLRPGGLMKDAPPACPAPGVLGCVGPTQKKETRKSQVIYLYLYLFIYQFIYLSIYIYIYLCIYIYLYLSISIYIYVYIYIYICIYIYLYLSISIYIYIYTYIYISIYIYIYTYIYLYLYIYISIYLSICLYLSLHISVHLYAYLYLFISICLYVYLTIYLSICVSIYLYFYVPFYLYLNLYMAYVFLQVFVGILNSIILFSSYPGFSFCLGCLFWLPSVISCRNPYIEYGMNVVHLSMIALNLATRGGDPLVNVKLPSFNIKCSQKLVNLGNLFLSSILIQKLLTYSFFGRCPLILFLSIFIAFSKFSNW